MNGICYIAFSKNKKQKIKRKTESEILKTRLHHRHEEHFPLFSLLHEEQHSYLSYIYHSLRWANRDQQKSHLHRKHVIPLPFEVFILSSANCCSFDTHLSMQVIPCICGKGLQKYGKIFLSCSKRTAIHTAHIVLLRQIIFQFFDQNAS